MKQNDIGILSLVLKLVIFSALMLTACNLWDDELDELENQETKWIENEPASYEYQYKHHCFCGEDYVGPFLVTIKNSEMVKVMRKSFEESEWTEIAPSEEHRIDYLFGEIEAHLKENPDRGHVEYDATYGYPTDVYFDMKISWNDEEWGVAVTSFKVLD